MQTQVVTLDLLKPIGTTVDLSDSFNARVGDKMTPFQLFITEDGVAKDLKGMHPELEAEVGNGALRNGVAVMAAGAKGVHWVGSTNNVTGYNQLTLAFPAEVFPQSGFCYGHLILANDAGVRETSVDIWFQVLDGTPLMGLVADHYDSELQLELAKARNANDQFSQEMRDTYNQQVIDAQNALTRATANLSSLAGTAGNIEAQITAQDIITRPEYNELSAQITDTLSHMDLQPENFTDEAALKSKYPKGDKGLKVTLDTMHKWIWVKGAWTDEGAYNFAGIDPTHQVIMNQRNSDNLVVNSDFKTKENWTIPAEWGIDSGNAINGSNLISTSRSGLTAAAMSFVSSDKIPAGNHSSVSFGWLVKAKNLDYTNSNNAWIELVGYDGNDQQTFSKQVFIANDPQDIELPLYKAEGIAMPNTTSYLITRIAINANGYLLAGRPQVNFGDHLLPYSNKQIDKDVESLKEDFASAQLSYTGNILGSHAITDKQFWSATTYSDDKIHYDPINNYRGMPTIKISNHDSSKPVYVGYKSKAFEVNQSPVSLQVPFMLSELGDGDTGYIEIAQYADPNADPIMTKDYYPTELNQFYLFKIENIELQPNVKYLVIRFIVQKNGAINISNPCLNYGNQCITYSSWQAMHQDESILKTVEATSKNALTQPLSDYHYVSGYQAGIDFNSFDEGNYTLEFNIPDSADTSWTTVDGDYVKTHGNVMSYSIRAKTQSADGSVIVTLREFASTNDKNPLQETSIYVGGPTYSKNYQKFFKENIVLNDKTNYVVVRYTMQKHGDTHFTDPVLNWSASLYAHDFGELSNQMRLPQLHLNATSQINNDYSVTSFSYRDGERLINGFMQIAWQGSSSRLYAKKNYKVKLFSDADCKNKLKLKLKSDWKANNKFNLKANWIDATQARNLVNAKLFAQATAVTPFSDPEVAEKLADTQNFGQMEGFPVEIYGAGGQYMGLYTFNTKKDEKTFGMDDKNPAEEAITCEINSANFSDATKTIDGETYATVVQDTASDELKINFTKFLQFLNTSTDDDFKAHLGDYIDVKSVINTYLWGFMSQMWDFDAKSMILLTWNSGKSYYMIPYDMDSTWGLHFDGAYVKDEDGWKVTPDAARLVGTNVLYKRLHKLFLDEIKSQYHYLRTTVWNNSQLVTAFKRYINAIPKEVYDREQGLWPAIPSKDITSFSQIQANIIKRMNAMDILMK